MIEIYRRENDWRAYHYREGDQIELKSISVSFSYDEVSRRIPI